MISYRGVQAGMEDKDVTSPSRWGKRNQKSVGQRSANTAGRSCLVTGSRRGKRKDAPVSSTTPPPDALESTSKKGGVIGKHRPGYD